MVNYYRRVVEKAAQDHLMTGFHGAHKPDGLRRTWPNLIAREGVMGLEYSKWTARITPDHNVMLPFTRMLAGPMDYTPGGFNNVTRTEFEPRMTKPRTRAHELALYVVFDKRLPDGIRLPGSVSGTEGLRLHPRRPNVWDEMRVVTGQPGEYVSIARRRGREWYLGSITGWRASTLTRVWCCG
jgi:alpha-glucosidase